MLKHTRPDHSTRPSDSVTLGFTTLNSGFGSHQSARGEGATIHGTGSGVARCITRQSEGQTPTTSHHLTLRPADGRAVVDDVDGSLQLWISRVYHRPSAGVAELADARDLGSRGATRAGSIPVARIGPQPGSRVRLVDREMTQATCIVFFHSFLE
jgi:hypothetical protein